MKLHFFTVRDVEDYRKYYDTSAEVQALLKKSTARTKEEFDQEFFFDYPKGLLGVPAEIYESRIWGDTGFPGLRLDFNFGLRLDIPEGNFRVKISDFNSGQVFFDKYISGGRLISLEKYFIHWQVDVFLDEEKIFSHNFNLENQPVSVIFQDSAALGDTIAFLPYFREFKKVYKCDLSVCLPKYLKEVVSVLYPELVLIDQINFKTYATYYPIMLSSFFPWVPTEARRISLNRMGGTFLGINYLPPKAIFKPSEPRITEEPYVCIAVQSNITRKGWLYPGGWDIIVDYLKSLGYRVFCIDRENEVENVGYTIRRPEGAEDFTGNRPLLERANMLYHAEFFIGLSSGLAWLADAVNCPVVMIAGFTLDWHEFYTPYRVSNRNVCNGCFNDIRVNYFRRDIPCPRHSKTPRELECQKKISPRMVIDAIERLIIDKNLMPPAFR